MTAPSRALLLYGTEEPVAPPRVLQAGPLAAELEDGNLRYIRFDGEEIIRAVSFLVRSPRWATYRAELAGLTVREAADRFEVGYQATVRDGDSVLDYAARIEGRADGVLMFRCDVSPRTDFVTCRTGFVVLHPAGVAGAAVRIGHADGSEEQGRFPALIDPVQPMLDLRALTHEAAPGLMVTCRMDGDVFEMEDQRNWTDASFKTYVRPLSRPWPYTLRAGETAVQSVTIGVRRSGAAARATRDGPIGLEAGAQIGSVPPIGLGCTAPEARLALPHAALLARARPAVLVCRFDTGAGQGAAELARFRELADACAAAVELQIVVHALHEYPAELHETAALVRRAGLVPGAVAVSPAVDLKSVTPGQPWPDCPPLDRLYAAAADAFPGMALHGGTFAYFTELNRKRPPLGRLDAVTFSTSPLVHAGDDRSVMESLEALPAVMASARAIAGDRKLLVGPSAIAMRDNPYGPAPLANPGGGRLAMSGADPRQRGLFGAAWTLGYIARLAAAGAVRVAVGAPCGACGIIDEAGRPLAVFPVIAGCAALRDARLHEVRVSRERDLAALLVQAEDRCELWLANLTAEAVTVALPEEFRPGTVQVLDVDRLADLAARDGALPPAVPTPTDRLLRCDAYAVVRCAAPGAG